ncbi:MAG TPA: hypothetical protein VGR71_04940, partial [Nitrospira sp.]|nr:hypothetical protein [Nitrospira sp.]
WYILTMLEGVRAVYVFDNRITREGFHLASLWLAVSTLLMALCYNWASKRPRRHQFGSMVAWPDTIDSWRVAIALMVVGFIMLCVAHGGLTNQLTELGTNTGGVVLALSFVGFAKYPYLHKVAFVREPALRDRIVLVMACLLTIINSRGLALTIILQTLLISSYCGREKKLHLLKYALVGIFIIVVYGSLRDFTHWRYSRGALGVEEIYQPDALKAFFIDRDFNFTSLFYEHSVGVFSGFAGILSYDMSYGLPHDIGVSLLLLLVHLAPYAVRTGLLSGLDEWLRAAYPYKGSVVPGGFEASFAHFGFAGVFAYAVALGVLPATIHNNLMSAKRDCLKWGLLAPYLLTFLMCDVSMATFFVLVELASLMIFRAILELTARNAVLATVV